MDIKALTLSQLIDPQLSIKTDIPFQIIQEINFQIYLQNNLVRVLHLHLIINMKLLWMKVIKS